MESFFADRWGVYSSGWNLHRLPALTALGSSYRAIAKGNISRMADESDMDDMVAGECHEELEEEDDFALNSSAVPLVQLPPEICKGLSPEFFTKDRKKFILKMLANDRSTLFDHQCELLDFVKENQCKAFALTYEACIGAGKTAATLALAGLLPRLHGAKLLYACPSEQRAVRIELGQMFYSATTTTSNVHFIFADVRRGELILKYNEHAMRSGRQEEVNPIDSHSIILASSEAAIKILTQNSGTPFLLFLDEFMTAAGHKKSAAFQCSMELIKVIMSRPNPQVILSSATSMGEHAVGLFEQMGFVTKRIQSAKHWATWDMFASASRQWHAHSGCKTRQHVETLEAAMEEPLFARMVSEDSVEDLTKVLPNGAVEGSGEVIGEYRFSLRRLLEEEEEVIEEICKQENLKPHSLRSDLQNWIDLAGKTLVLLAVSQVDAAIGFFQQDIEYVQGKVMAGDARGSFGANLKKKNMSKLFRACFFKKEPFHVVWQVLEIGQNQRHLNLAILLTAGIGVLTESLHDEWPDYAHFVCERAKMGHLHLLIADASLSHGVNFAISRVVLSKSLVEAQPASTIFQLMGRAGRRGFSNEAKILTCELWRQKLMRGLQDGEDLFEVDRVNVCEALRSCAALGDASDASEINIPHGESREGHSEIPGKRETKQHGENAYKPSRDIEEGSATPEPTWWNSFIGSILDHICCCGRR